MNTSYVLPVKETPYGEVVKLKPDLYDMSDEAVAQRSEEGWKRNASGKPPAKDGASADVIYRNGESSKRCRIGRPFDGASDWSLTNDPRDIVEYKLLGNGIFA